MWFGLVIVNFGFLNTLADLLRICHLTFFGAGVVSMIETICAALRASLQAGSQPRRPLVARTNGATKDDPRDIFGQMKQKD